MYNGAILYIAVVANMYIIYIATYHRIKPDRAIIAYYHFAYYGGVFGNKTFFTKNGAFIFYG